MSYQMYGSELNRQPERKTMQTARIATTAALTLTTAIVSLTIVFGSWYTIDEGERGVITRNGAVTGVATPGLGFKMPVMDDVTSISVRTEIMRFEGLQAYSKDQQTATMKVSVNYRIVPEEVKNVYTQWGSAEGLAARLVQPRVNEELKTAFGQFTAVSSIQNREQLNTAVREAIANSVKGPVVVEGVQIENIDFSEAYEDSIEKRMAAEVEVQKLQQNAQREKVQAEITVTQAKAAADSQRAAADAKAYSTELQAKAQASATKLAGEAEAEAIKAKGAALRDNPSLIELTQAERWNGQLPTTMVPGAAVPFIGVK